MIKRIVAALVAVALVFSLGACSNYQTATDQQAVHEKAGPLTNPEVDDCKKPGDRGRDGVFENFYYYPAGPRSWLFSDDAGADHAPYNVYVKSPKVDGEAGQAISLPVSGEVTLSLTSDCDKLKELHRDYGRKYQAYSEERGTSATSQGWTDFLNAKLSPAIQNGLNLGMSKTTYDVVVADPEFRKGLQPEVADYIVESLNTSLGDDYFTDLQITIYQPTLPGKIQDAIDQNEAAKQFNIKVETEKETMKDLVKILGPNGYILYKALQDGDITVLPVPQGSGVSLPQK